MIDYYTLLESRAAFMPGFIFNAKLGDGIFG